MAQFTDSNTEGFSETELAVLNGAFDIVAARTELETMDDDLRYQFEQSICDAINNAWIGGQTAEQLAARVRL
ncbi:hypothetical protein [Novosphingobium sp. FSW06-99]|uniref:hypothetical protein n=1 Tax=Novosphingobium sp. FSW06-99 TaxID=1739113 RepID=UPI0012E3355F|nr:hypothetical protein [Novosphingobium sp. FSW06-99]